LKILIRSKWFKLP